MGLDMNVDLVYAEILGYVHAKIETAAGRSINEILKKRAA